MIKTLFILAAAFILRSPDGTQKLSVDVSEADGVNKVSYSVEAFGRQAVLPSTLDVTLDNSVWERAVGKRSLPKLERWFDNFKLVGKEEYSRDTLWHNPYGERSVVKDACNALVLHFAKDDGSDYRLDIEFRAYDEGVAMRYRLPKHPSALYHRVAAENTEFSLPEGTKAWHAAWAQAQYQLIPLSDWDDAAERPLTLELPNGLYLALGEAGVVDFPICKFRLSETRPSTLVTSLNDNGTDLVTPYDFPWRVILTAQSLGGLLERNDIFLNLNEPSRIADAESWVKPGKILRETRQTTENSLACIDFAARHNIDYILYDWKWYGPADDFSIDATKVVAPIDMPRVVSYGREKGVGVWVYVNQHALQMQGKELFRTYEQWGLKGVKFGFVQYTSQHWSDWVHSLVRDAADYHIMVNIHDEYRPTGYSRTYPNLMTQEGICGNEEFPSANHNTHLPFTRMLCGAADYTVCYFDPRLKMTHAHQLALPVMYFSPLQTLYWYDSPDRIEEVPELEFFDRVPTVWDDTKVVSDKVDECVAIARRSGLEWYMGVLTGDAGASAQLPVSFLEPGVKYLMKVFTDDPSVETPTHVKVSTYQVTAADVLKFNLLPSGGAAVIFTPATNLKKVKKLSSRTIL